MAVETIRVGGVRGLVDQVLAITNALDEGRFLWFRGLDKEGHTLTPKLMRDGKNSDSVFERERRLLTRFRQRSMAYWPQGYPQDDWEMLFAMQHYGIPTRLLDWSENLFVACHFAFSSGIDQADSQPVVWCIDPVAWNRATPALSDYGESIHVLTTADSELEPYQPNSDRKKGRTPVAIFGTHNSQRIVSQRGTFMVWGNDTAPLEQFAEDGRASTLWKLIVEGERQQIANDLRALGFGETMVFPELPSLAIELSRVEGWRA